ncbi:MAG: RdgB/HAM1 family non-canonical purine NTP pyrophosphatase [Elusimicrobiota bacterium]
MQIVLATGNKDKVKEIKNIWSNIENITFDWSGNYRQLKEVEESGKTLRENASLKAEYVADSLEKPAIADDTGLFVKHLDGKPGVYSSRYAGREADYEDNVNKLLKELKGVPEKERYAEFRTVVAFSRKGKKTLFTEGVVKGRITNKRRGENGFGYDPVFEVSDLHKTFGELPEAKKNTVSHRYKALKKMEEIINREVAQLG